MARIKNEALHSQRKQQILQGAKKCFAAQGFHQTSMRQILSAANISTGAAYNYFSSKADIVKAFVIDERADISELIGRLKSSNKPLTGISRLVYEAIRYTSHDEAVLSVQIYAEVTRDPDISSLAQENINLLKVALTDALNQGIKSGVINKRYSVDHCIELIIALIEGSIGRIAQNPELKSAHLADIAKDSIERLLTNA